MALNTSEWSNNRIVARNRIQKTMSLPREFATQTVYHFSESACEAIANAADDDVRGVILKERARVESVAMKDHQKDVQNTFALAAVAEVVRGDKTPEELAQIVIATDSVDALIAVFDDLDDDAIDRIAAVGNRLTAACDAVRAKRIEPAPPTPDTAPPTDESPAEPPKPKKTAKKTSKPKKPASDASEDATAGEDATT